MFVLSQAVGKNCPNRPDDVKALHKRLMAVAKIPCYVSNGFLDDTLVRGIVDVQRYFMSVPDGVITVNSATHKFLSEWSIKPINAGVQLPGRLKEAWDLINPLLPKGSHCTSGYRSPEAQRKILHRFFLYKYKTEIVAKYGMKKYESVQADLAKNEDDVIVMVRGVGQDIAKPGRSAHQKRKAIDVGGPDVIDKQQVDVIKLVARVHLGLFSGKVLKERNGCVHFEIR